MNKLKLFKGIAVIACACTASVAAALTLTACGDKKDEAHTHTYGEWETVTAATCETAGEERRVCSGCAEGTEGHSETRVVDPLGHDWDDGQEEPPATCASTGTRVYRCRRNQAHTKLEAIPKVAHEYGEWQFTYPTNSTPGKAVKTCANCTEQDSGHKVERDLPVLTDENYTVEDNTATCAKAGTAKFTITVNGDEISFTTQTEATGIHLKGKWQDLNGRKPTDLVAISVNKICDECGQVMDTQTLAGLNYSHVTNGEYTYQEINPATCTSKGLAKYTTNYEKLKADDVYYTFEADIPMIPHSYKFETEPKTGASGTAKLVCDYNCGFEQSVEYGDYLTAGGAAQDSPVKISGKKYLMKITESGSNFFAYDLKAEEGCVIKVTITPLANAIVQTDMNFAALVDKEGKVQSKGEWQDNNGGFRVMNYAFFTSNPKDGISGNPNAVLKDFTLTVTDGADFGQSYVFNLIAKNASEELPAFFTVDVEYEIGMLKYGQTSNYVGISQETNSSVFGFQRADGDPEYFQFAPDDKVLTLVQSLKVTLDKDGDAAGTVIYDSATENTEGKFEIHDTELHTLRFEVGKTASVAVYDSAISVKILQSDASGVVPDNNLRPDNKVSVSVPARNGTAKVEISNVAEPGWYKIYPTWSNIFGQANLSVKINDGPSKNLQIGAAPSTGKNYDNFAVVAYLKPGDILTYTNPGFNTLALQLNMVAHEHGTKAFTITKPSADKTGKAKRDCDGVYEEFVLPVLGDENYTVEGNKYTIVIDGVTIEFTV